RIASARSREPMTASPAPHLILFYSAEGSVRAAIHCRYQGKYLCTRDMRESSQITNAHGGPGHPGLHRNVRHTHCLQVCVVCEAAHKWCLVRGRAMAGANCESSFD